MVNVKGRVTVHTGEARSRSRRPPAIESGTTTSGSSARALVAANTLLHYDRMVLPFLDWLDGQEVRRFDDLDVGLVRAYRAQLAARPGQHGRPLQPKTILESRRRSCASWGGRGARATGSTSDGCRSPASCCD